MHCLHKNQMTAHIPYHGPIQKGVYLGFIVCHGPGCIKGGLSGGGKPWGSQTSPGFFQTARIDANVCGGNVVNSLRFHASMCGVSMMSWGGSLYHPFTPLVIINGKINAQRYVVEIHEPVVIPLLELSPSGDPCLSARQSPSSFIVFHTRFFGWALEVNLLSWPVRLHKTAISHYDPPGRNRREFVQAVLMQWDNIPQETIQTDQFHEAEMHSMLWG